MDAREKTVRTQWRQAPDPMDEGLTAFDGPSAGNAQGLDDAGIELGQRHADALQRVRA